MKQRGWKWLGCLAASALLLAVPAQAQESGGELLTLDAAVGKAWEHSKSLAELDRTIAELGRQHEDLVELSEDMQAMLDAFDKYHKLHEKMQNGGLDEVEAIQYRGYQMRYGPVPPEWDDEDLFNRIIKNRDIPHKQLQVVIENTERSREMARAGLAMQTRSMFDQWLALEGQLGLVQSNLEQLQQQEAEMAQRFRTGAASEWDMYNTQVDVKQQERQIAKLERGQENLELSLKMVTGIPLDQPIRLTSYELAELDAPISELDVYLEQADRERTEVQNARSDYENKLREYNLFTEYIADLDDFDRIETEKMKNTAKFDLETVRLDTKTEVHQAYRQVLSKRQELSTAERQYALAEKRLQQAQASAAQGVAKASDVSGAELGRLQAELAREQKEREYAFAVYQLQLTCTTGPGAAAVAGGGR